MRNYRIENGINPNVAHRVVEIYLSEVQATELHNATGRRIAGLTNLDHIVIKQGKPVIDFVAKSKHGKGPNGQEYQKGLRDKILHFSSVDLIVHSGYRTKDKMTGMEIERPNREKVGNRSRQILEALERMGYDLYTGNFVGAYRA